MELAEHRGLITVAKDYTGQTDGFAQSAYLSLGQSVHRFFAKILMYLAKVTTTGNTTLRFHVTGGTTATASGRVGSVAVSGKASVRVLNVSASRHSELGVVSGYFAPASQVGRERNELASIGGCYAPERGTLFRFFKDPQFGYVMPPGWSAIERPGLLFLHDGPNACGPTQTSSTGATEQEVFYFFLGHVGTKAVHGEARVISSTGGGVTSGILRFALTTPSLWNSLNGGHMWAALSIQRSYQTVRNTRRWPRLRQRPTTSDDPGQWSTHQTPSPDSRQRDRGRCRLGAAAWGPRPGAGTAEDRAERVRALSGWHDRPMTTTTTPIVGVDFVMFPTRDLAAAVAFYGTTLGLPCSVHMPERGFAEFEAGSMTLNVAMTENFPMGYHPNPNPVALHVDDVADARKELSARGLAFEGETFDTGVCHMAFFSDPDGNALMLHHRYAPRVTLT